MKTITPTAKQHPLIIDGPLKNLYQDVIKCKACPRLVDFREKIAKGKRKEDKRQTIKQREWNRQKFRIMKENN